MASARDDAVEDRCRVIGENRGTQMTDQVEQLLGKHIVPVLGRGIDTAVIGQKVSVITFVGCNLHGVGHCRKDGLQFLRQPLRDSHLLRKMPHSDAVGRCKQHLTYRQRLDHRRSLDR